MEHIFKEFVLTYNKKYNDEEEYNKRLEIFTKNYEFINNHNSENGDSFKLDVNEFADMTTDEFNSLYLN